MTTPTRVSNAKSADRFDALAEARHALLEDDVRKLMSCEWGRRLAYWIAYELGGLHGPVFAFDLKYNAELYAAWRDGRRAVSGDFTDLLKELTPDHFLAMVAEQMKARLADAALDDAEEQRRSAATGDDTE